MANVLTVLQSSKLLAQRRIRYKIVLSGNYVQAGAGTTPPTGELLVLSNAVGKYDVEQYWGQQGPNHGEPSQPPAGYTAQIIPTSDPNTWVFKIFSAPGAELAAGAYPAAITADLNAYIAFWGANYK